MKLRINNYYDLERAAAVVRDGLHREFVGGLWGKIGKLQFEFAYQRGLTPDMYVLDVGCGCLRGGIHFVDYLDAGHYYGIDISQDLLDAGYDQELRRLKLDHKLPRENLACNGEFAATEFGITFDVAMAQSLFTHLPLNHVKLCLARVAAVMRPGAVFYATVFLCPDEHDWTEPLAHPPGKITTHPADDPYHYRAGDLAYCAAGLPWRCEVVGDWGHARGQSMVIFTRTD